MARSWLRILIVLAVIALTIPTTPAATSLAPACPARDFVAGIGMACVQTDGLLQVFAADGSFIGTTHGRDPVLGTSEPIEVAAAKPPACVAGASGEYYVKVIYARASNDADNYAASVAPIRALVEGANGIFSEAAAATGGSADFKVLCSGGVISVANEVLPTPKASATFSTIVTDLRAKGYNTSNVKHWVFYDDTGACGCAGTGHLYNDDRLIEENYNNGAAGTVPEFAVNFGYTGATGITVMLHELGHNLGAVQNSAPHSSLAGHCFDGKDTMCYNDGGANSVNCTPDFYCSSYCGVQIFDCGKDDYFNSNPTPGSYLATHWNIAHSYNRFIIRGAPLMQSLDCSTPKGVGQLVFCNMTSSDDELVRYSISWGDGATTCAPSCSTFTTPSAVTTATHAYSTGGVKTVTVTPTDNHAAPQSGAPLARNVNIDASPPITTLTLSGTSANKSSGYYSSTVTIGLSAIDGGSGVAGRYYQLDGGPTTTFVANVAVTTVGPHALTYWSVDLGGNVEAPRTANFVIDKTLPTASFTLSCALCLDDVNVSWTASDASAGLESAYVAWRYPENPSLTSDTECVVNLGGAATASRTCSLAPWLGVMPGTYCVKVSTQDRAGNRFTTTEKCATVL